MSIRVRLINKKHVKEFALEMAKHRAHKFTRVGGEFQPGRLQPDYRAGMAEFVRGLGALAGRGYRPRRCSPTGAPARGSAVSGAMGTGTGGHTSAEALP